MRFALFFIFEDPRPPSSAGCGSGAVVKLLANWARGPIFDLGSRDYNFIDFYHLLPSREITEMMLKHVKLNNIQTNQNLSAERYWKCEIFTPTQILWQPMWLIQTLISVDSLQSMMLTALKLTANSDDKPH